MRVALRGCSQTPRLELRANEYNRTCGMRVPEIARPVHCHWVGCEPGPGRLRYPLPNVYENGERAGGHAGVRDDECIADTLSGHAPGQTVDVHDQGTLVR